MAIPFKTDITLEGFQALRLRLHNITSGSDFSPQRDGSVGYMSATDDKRIAFWDSQLSSLIKLPRLDRSESVTGTWAFSPASGAPFTVGSTTKVTNLNADLLDGANSASAATASTIALRDASGRLKAATPVASDDVATRQ